jgi:hypothetical protein
MLEFICADLLIRGAEILPTFRAGRTIRGGCTSVLGASAARWGSSDCTTGGSVGTFSTGVLATDSTGFASAEVLTIGALVSDGTARGAGSAAAGAFCKPGMTPP